jgi:hypothetical protein
VVLLKKELKMSIDFKDNAEYYLREKAIEESRRVSSGYEFDRLMNRALDLVEEVRCAIDEYVHDLEPPDLQDLMNLHEQLNNAVSLEVRAMIGRAS